MARKKATNTLADRVARGGPILTDSHYGRVEMDEGRQCECDAVRGIEGRGCGTVIEDVTLSLTEAADEARVGWYLVSINCPNLDSVLRRKKIVPVFETRGFVALSRDETA